ncbi:MAG: hypothetical protein KCHDKBKB_00676 [Elusimicrobia bacterium]|nr:hypothetical protein [Elusimicrobiota bacterium]
MPKLKKSYAIGIYAVRGIFGQIKEIRLKVLRGGDKGKSNWGLLGAKTLKNNEWLIIDENGKLDTTVEKDYTK